MLLLSTSAMHILLWASVRLTTIYTPYNDSTTASVVPKHHTIVWDYIFSRIFSHNPT